MRLLVGPPRRLSGLQGRRKLPCRPLLANLSVLHLGLGWKHAPTAFQINTFRQVQTLSQRPPQNSDQEVPPVRPEGNQS